MNFNHKDTKSLRILKLQKKNLKQSFFRKYWYVCLIPNLIILCVLEPWWS